MNGYNHPKKKEINPIKMMHGENLNPDPEGSNIGGDLKNKLINPEAAVSDQEVRKLNPEDVGGTHKYVANKAEKLPSILQGEIEKDKITIEVDKWAKEEDYISPVSYNQLKKARSNLKVICDNAGHIKKD